MPFVGAPSGFVVDKVVQANLVPLLTMRKIFQVLGTALPSIFLLILCFWPNPRPEQSVAIMVCALVTAPFTAAGYTSNFIDVSTKHAGVLFSITNTFATIPGIAGVYLTGFISDRTSNPWTIVFLIATSIYLFAMVIYILFAKAEQIDFDKDKTLNIQINIKEPVEEK